MHPGQGPVQAAGVPTGAEGRDLVEAVERFRDAIANRLRRVLEQIVENRHVIGHQRRLIAVELRADFRDHGRVVVRNQAQNFVPRITG